MKNTRFFLSENFHFLMVKFSIYLNRHVFIMICVQSVQDSVIYFIKKLHSKLQCMVILFSEI